MKIVERLSAVLYGVAAVALAAIALIMIAYSAVHVWQALWRAGEIERALLDAVGMVIVSVAVFDVAKYLLEEGVVRRQELRSPAEARTALTKFLAIIIMAVALETLVFVFIAGRTDMRDLVYPAFLLFAVILAPLALGLFQYFSRRAEAASGKDRD